MIKTFNINLAGQIFNINEDAYEQLLSYFNSLEKFYANEEGRDEILNDIKSRFAELFLAKGKNYIITMEDANAAINNMGKPEDFDEDAMVSDTATVAGQKTHSAEQQHIPGKKRLYRDSDNALVAGICAGLSNYIGVSDPIWIRIAFILLTISTLGFWMFLIYPVLWFIMPEAVTSTEKLEMKGESINLSNIQKTIREESNQLNNAITAKKGLGERIMSFLGACVKIFFKFLLGIIIFILGCVLLGIALAFIGCMIALIVVGLVTLFGIPVINRIFFENASDGWFLGFGGLLIGIIPIVFIILGIVHILSKKSKPLKKQVVFPLLGLFLFGLLLLNISGFHAKQLLSEKRRINQTFPLDYTYKSDTLQLSINPTIRDEDMGDNIHVNGISGLLELISENDDKFFPIEIEIFPSMTDSFSVVKEFSASGRTDKEAIQNATAYTHQITQVNNKLIIDPFIQFESDKVKFRNQKLKVKVYVPEGKVIRWDERTEKYMDEGKLVINWDNVKSPLPPLPPIPPLPPNSNHKIEIKTSKGGDTISSSSKIIINIDSDNEDINAALDKAQEKLDAARERLEEEQINLEDSLDDVLNIRLSREHYIFRMVNGELIAID